MKVQRRQCSERIGGKIRYGMPVPEGRRRDRKLGLKGKIKLVSEEFLRFFLPPGHRDLQDCEEVSEGGHVFFIPETLDLCPVPP